MATVPTFIRWLSQQRDRDDPIGDLARETQHDPRWPRRTTNPSVRTLAQYLHAVHGLDYWWRHETAMDALFVAYREWHAAGGRYRDPARPIGAPMRRLRGVSLSLRFQVFKRDGYRCQICGRTAAHDAVKLEVDHRIAFAKGGTNTMENLWTLCWECNRGKRDGDL